MICLLCNKTLPTLFGHRAPEFHFRLHEEDAYRSMISFLAKIEMVDVLPIALRDEGRKMLFTVGEIEKEAARIGVLPTSKGV